MRTDRHIKRNGWIVGIAIGFAASSAWAAAAAPEGSVKVAAGYGAENTQELSPTAALHSYRPLEAGVRRAAMQGPEALRRYIWRTRMIYDYYYPDFVPRHE